ncbi:hypothetical protein [Streptomyces sp. NBC_00872]|uniref:hypothetical protein n=1 Tax=Streptomyces sp. NBC_00872 TaxID=2903686 RepID=UPI0038697DD0|nr:hypothetical protein OG214_14345 [Streptomyces sp. NBC_00872]
MRPSRFQDFTLDLAKNSPGVTRVQTLAEAGDTKHPFGLAITTGDGEARWQIMGQLAESEKHEHADVPVNGDPVQVVANPASGDHEGWLAAAVARAESPEIASIERWSTRPGQGNSRGGLTVAFHNGARAFVRRL